MDYLDELKADIESRKEAADWKVPETIKKMTAISERLEKQLVSIEELETLRGDKKDLEAANKKLKIANQELTDTQDQLRDKVQRLTEDLRQSVVPAEEFTLTNGKSKDLVKNKVTLGVESVYPSSVVFSINNEQHTLSSGNKLRINAYDRGCILTVSELAYPAVTFKLVCDTLSEG
ncbi:hypothetical protein LH705_18420 [Pseudomonas putida]|uniref:hypothetical protein n=1 Tax=Pseudomonas putida TaxID=303 RepID=UPI001F27F4C5|nr:hypothetical protein [Pseudomonas putida]MCF1251508.1 hypothetical protein [Pseudomonas putida]